MSSGDVGRQGPEEKRGKRLEPGPPWSGVAVGACVPSSISAKVKCARRRQC